MAEENFEILDGESSSSWGKNEGLTFQQILMQQLSRTTQALSDDMIEGHWKTIPLKTGSGTTMMTQVYIPDGRMKAINCVKTFYDLLLPRFDEEMQKKDKEIKEKIIAKKKLYLQENYKNSTWIDAELKFYRKIFQELNLLIARLGYFQEEAITM